jgi:hypothetical protein
MFHAVAGRGWQLFIWLLHLDCALQSPGTSANGDREHCIVRFSRGNAHCGTKWLTTLDEISKPKLIRWAIVPLCALKWGHRKVANQMRWRDLPRRWVDTTSELRVIYRSSSTEGGRDNMTTETRWSFWKKAKLGDFGIQIWEGIFKYETLKNSPSKDVQPWCNYRKIKRKEFYERLQLESTTAFSWICRNAFQGEGDIWKTETSPSLPPRDRSASSSADRNLVFIIPDSRVPRAMAAPIRTTLHCIADFCLVPSASSPHPLIQWA